MSEAAGGVEQEGRRNKFVRKANIKYKLAYCYPWLLILQIFHIGFLVVLELADLFTLF